HRVPHNHRPPLSFLRAFRCSQPISALLHLPLHSQVDSDILLCDGCARNTRSARVDDLLRLHVTYIQPRNAYHSHLTRSVFSLLDAALLSVMRSLPHPSVRCVLFQNVLVPHSPLYRERRLNRQVAYDEAALYIHRPACLGTVLPIRRLSNSGRGGAGSRPEAYQLRHN
ncbi:hypothetical protein PFISCL1PPCAC_17068, partial [Pristionchus fissidentatus]